MSSFSDTVSIFSDKTHVDLRVEGDRIVIERVNNPPRRGWAVDAATLAAEGDDDMVWPDFANDEDARLVW